MAETLLNVAAAMIVSIIVNKIYDHYRKKELIKTIAKYIVDYENKRDYWQASKIANLQKNIAFGQTNAICGQIG